MKFIVNLLLTALLVLLLSYILPGVETAGYLSAIIVSLVIALLNFLVRPILVILTIPITIVTLGLFLLVVNAIIILLADFLVPGFTTGGFWSALLFAILLSIGKSILDRMVGADD
jgi:putative membrane protein